MMKMNILRKGSMLTAAVFFLTGCIPGIMVAKKGAKIEDRPIVEYRLGNEVEVKDWMILKQEICSNLNYATEGLPHDIRKDIFKYSCIENDKYALGNTLQKLSTPQFQNICSRLSEKGLPAECDQTTSRSEESVVTFVLPIVIIAAVFM